MDTHESLSNPLHFIKSTTAQPNQGIKRLTLPYMNISETTNTRLQSYSITIAFKSSKALQNVYKLKDLIAQEETIETICNI